MKKIFIDSQTVRDNTLKLSQKIHQDGFIPDIIYVSLRGGASMGNVISEYYKLLTGSDVRPVYYAAVVARSYEGPQEQSQDIMIDGWTYTPEHLRHGDRVMIVDDIFDSGYTVNRLVNIITAQGIPKKQVRVVVHDYKLRHYQDEHLPVHPDYYCNKYDIAAPDEDYWIHYLSHEFVGLSEEEIKQHYSKDIQDILFPLIKK